MKSFELARLARRWSETDALYLHIAMCLLAGEWTSCEHCRPLMAELSAPVKHYVKNRERRRKRAVLGARLS